MTGHAISLPVRTLRERFAAAGAREPLCSLGAADRAELAALLDACPTVDALPGRWQAALLAAEGASGSSGGCCGAGEHRH